MLQGSGIVNVNVIGHTYVVPAWTSEKMSAWEKGLWAPCKLIVATLMVTAELLLDHSVHLIEIQLRGTLQPKNVSLDCSMAVRTSFHGHGK